MSAEVTTSQEGKGSISHLTVTVDLGGIDSSLPVGIIQGTAREDHSVISNNWAVT